MVHKFSSVSFANSLSHHHGFHLLYVAEYLALWNDNNCHAESSVHYSYGSYSGLPTNYELKIAVFIQNCMDIIILDPQRIFFFQFIQWVKINVKNDKENCLLFFQFRVVPQELHCSFEFWSKKLLPQPNYLLYFLLT